MVKRCVKLSESHSFFLFGARGTGKTTLLESHFPSKTTLFIDLLDSRFDELLYKNPESLIQLIDAQKNIEWVVIDEIQKNPKLLDVVHKLTKNKKIKFALTGSSARKIKRNSANLLAGRAFKYHCHPITSYELDAEFNLEEILQFGSLPEILSLKKQDKKDYLRSYVETYFKEEIVAEQIVRKLRPFKNFLEVAAQMNGKILNMNKIAKDVGVDHTTVQNYFEILDDTLVAFLLPPYHESIRKRQRQSAKFYYFDLGVTRALQKQLDQTLQPQNFQYGDLFEQFVILEIKRLADYFKPDWTFSYLRTKDDAEIDLIIERPGLKKVAIEIKSTENVSNLTNTPEKSFCSLVKDLDRTEGYFLSQDPIEKKIDGIWCLPWKKGLHEIGLI